MLGVDIGLLARPKQCEIEASFHRTLGEEAHGQGRDSSQAGLSLAFILLLSNPHVVCFSSHLPKQVLQEVIKGNLAL